VRACVGAALLAEAGPGAGRGGKEVAMRVPGTPRGAQGMCGKVLPHFFQQPLPPDRAPWTPRAKAHTVLRGRERCKLSPTGSWIAVISCARLSPPIREGRDACSCSWAVLRPPERFPSVC